MTEHNYRMSERTRKVRDDFKESDAGAVILFSRNTHEYQLSYIKYWQMLYLPSGGISL